MSKELNLYKTWLQKAAINPQYKSELESISGNDPEITDRFYRDLDFGTAGLRGVIGLGTNRMNIFTVRRATQGFASFLLEGSQSPVVAIAYDSRNFSDIFAREAACVFAANKIRVHIYSELMPTPALSYAVRELGCDAGIVITASHNPAKYNGYKAYGSDGCQIGPEQADRVMEYITKTDIFDEVKTISFELALDQKLISYIPESFVQSYIDRVYKEALHPNLIGEAGLKLVYTPLNGAGNRCVQTILKKAGIKDLYIVKEQEQPDGDFPTCPYPNPEIRETLQLGIELCKKTDADLLLATDPDSDRVAVAVKSNGDYRIITGNELGVLLLDYICRTRIKNGTMPQNPIAVKSIVSSKLADVVAKEYGVEMVNVLTGFKFIGEVILGLEKNHEENRYILGFEESCGYLTGSYVRDKDAVNASLLTVEMASALKLENKTLADSLDEIYSRHGVYYNAVESFTFEGSDGMKKMYSIMSAIRLNLPQQINSVGVVSVSDYKTSVRTDSCGESKIDLPSSDAIEFVLQDKCGIIVRPSGTEPKLKLYYSIVAADEPSAKLLYNDYSKAAKQLIGV